MTESERNSVQMFASFTGSDSLIGSDSRIAGISDSRTGQ